MKKFTLTDWTDFTISVTFDGTRTGVFYCYVMCSGIWLDEQTNLK